MNKNAVCLITKNPCEKEPYLKFLNTFKMYDVFVIIDDNDNDYSLLKEKYEKLHFIQINKDVCEYDGFKNSNYIALYKNVTGWDKAIFYFTKKTSNKYDNVWFFEDDVFFYSENTIKIIDNKYKSEDILCNSSYETGKLNEWVWNRIEINFPQPYFCGMMCIIRLSNNYFKCIEDYVNKNKTLFFLEAFFPSIAKHYNLKTIENPEEFLTVTYKEPIENLKINRYNLYHPAKKIDEHFNYRKVIYNLYEIKDDQK
jgi:hypothetical protein